MYTLASHPNAQAIQVEIWVVYHDIFVRNAFGNFGDLLREVVHSPMMGRYLTYMDSKAHAWGGKYPSESMAREVLALFTVGLHRLNHNGTLQLDAAGRPREAFSNEDVADVAKVFTGFDEHRLRTNIEAASRDSRVDNDIDPMLINVKYKDVFPKMGLDGIYLGDTFPLCGDLLPRGFLRAGALFRYFGDRRTMSNEPWQLGAGLALQPSSALHRQLCNATPATRTDAQPVCQFAREVVLSEHLRCDSKECDIDSTPSVLVSSGDGTAAFYEYMRPPCATLAFVSDGIMVKDGYDALCADPQNMLAGATCCARDGRENAGVGQCVFDEEEVTFATANARCSALRERLCPVSTTYPLYVRVAL